MDGVEIVLSLQGSPGKRRTKIISFPGYTTEGLSFDYSRFNGLIQRYTVGRNGRRDSGSRRHWWPQRPARWGPVSEHRPRRPGRVLESCLHCVHRQQHARQNRPGEQRLEKHIPSVHRRSPFSKACYRHGEKRRQVRLSSVGSAAHSANGAAGGEPAAKR